MHRKLIVVIIILSFMVTGIFSQLSLVSAHHNDPPVTGPLTPPLTSFAHSISGKVVLRFLGWLHHLHPNSEPAEDVTIKARKFFSSDIFTTQTDSNGEYELFVPNGLYHVSADDENDTFFVPTIRAVHLKKHDKDNVNFTGLVFH